MHSELRQALGKDATLSEDFYLHFPDELPSSQHGNVRANSFPSDCERLALMSRNAPCRSSRPGSWGRGQLDCHRCHLRQPPPPHLSLPGFSRAREEAGSEPAR